MSTPTPGNDSKPLPGRNRVSSQALTTLTQATAGAALGVGPQDVRVTFNDDGGALAVSLSSPVASPGLGRIARMGLAGEQPLLQRCISAKAKVGSEVSRLAGTQISRVDIRLTSVKFPGAEAVVDKPSATPAEPKRRVI